MDYLAINILIFSSLIIVLFSLKISFNLVLYNQLGGVVGVILSVLFLWIFHRKIKKLSPNNFKAIFLIIGLICYSLCLMSLEFVGTRGLQSNNILTLDENEIISIGEAYCRDLKKINSKAMLCHSSKESLKGIKDIKVISLPLFMAIKEDQENGSYFFNKR